LTHQGSAFRANLCKIVCHLGQSRIVIRDIYTLRHFNCSRCYGLCSETLCKKALNLTFMFVWDGLVTK